MYISKLLVFFVIATQSNAQRKVFAGEEAKDTKDLPILTNIKITEEGKGGNGCGGSYILDYWVLTASHCVSQWFPIKDNKPKYEILICMGHIEADVEKCPKEDKRSVDKLYPFSDDVKGAYWKTHDICLMHITKPFVLSETVKLAKLPPKKVDINTLNKKECMAGGWGMVSPKQEQYKTLKQGKVKISIGDEENCPTEYPKQVCSRGVTAVTCQGDSGGPLLCDGVVYGVLRGGQGECDNIETKTSIWVLVHEYLDWIDKTTGRAGGGGANNIIPNYLCLCILPMILLKL